MKSIHILVVAAALAGTIALNAPTVDSATAAKQVADHGYATRASKIADCERRGFYADLSNGDCTTMRMPGGMR